MNVTESSSPLALNEPQGMPLDIRTPQWILVSAVLAVFTLAFLPTLIVDYVPMDQWRAFRYSLVDQGPRARLDACLNIDPAYYTATGRPLVWPGECIEQALVGRIADFKKLRPYCFAIVILSLFGLAYTLRRVTEDRASAFIIAGLALYSPSYCFMYYQGATAAPVLVAALLGFLSAGVLIPVKFDSLAEMRRSIPRILASVGLVVLADLMYPAYAATGVAILTLYAAFDKRLDSYSRFRRFLCGIAVYGVASLGYLVLSKAIIFVYFRWNPQRAPVLHALEGSKYALALSLTPATVITKLNVMWFYLSNRLPLSSFYGVPAILKYAILAGLVIAAIVQAPAWSARKRFPAVALSLALFGLLFAMLAMVAPWFVSGFVDDLGGRQALPWAVLISCGLGLLWLHFFRVLRPQTAPATLSYVLFGLLFFPASVRQLKSSVDQVMMSNVEVRFFRSSVKGLVASGELSRIHHLHVIRPDNALHYDGTVRRRDDDESVLPAAAANPEHIATILTAVLRELLPPAELTKLKIYDCRFDQQCASAVSTSGGLALTQGYGSDPVPQGPGSAVIDFRLAELGPVKSAGAASVGRPAVSVYPASIKSPGELAFDDNPKTFFESLQGFPVSLIIKSSKACQPVASYVLTSHIATDEMATAWRLFGRNSEADQWELLDQREGVGPWAGFESRKFLLRQRVCLNDLKFDFLRSGDAQKLRISEIGFSGNASDGKAVEQHAFDAISASSVLLPYTADGLLEAKQPGWHAAPPVTYPQVLTFYFKEARQVESVSFLPQDQNTDRGPKSIEVELSDSGLAWRKVATIANACTSTGVWSSHRLRKSVLTQHIRLRILTNCGNPSLLTLRGVKFTP
ncbi:MAG TPA: discoidin domain-containing protein [Bryobacteraceae bacterium]|jgi:hypothetical protein